HGYDEPPADHRSKFPGNGAAAAHRTVMRQRNDEIARQWHFALERELGAADRHVLHLALGDRLAVRAVDHPTLRHRMTLCLALFRTHDCTCSGSASVTAGADR